METELGADEDCRTQPLHMLTYLKSISSSCVDIPKRQNCPQLSLINPNCMKPLRHLAFLHQATVRLII